MKLNLDKNKNYLLACSYGPDSMCLFDLLFRAGITFSVANVNYNLREESKKESDDLRQYCKKLEIQYFGLNVKEQINSNIEEKCREIRYQFFKNVFKLGIFDALLVAHNEDDHFETYYLQKKRGGIVEYYGLQEESVMGDMPVIRPLLDYSKKALQEYDDVNKVPYCIDKSNYEDDYERNKIRHSIVSKLKPKERILLKAKIANENVALLSKHLKILEISTNEIKDIKKLNDKDFAYYLVMNSRSYLSDIEYSLSRVKEIRKALCSKKPNIVINLKDNLCLVKSYENFYFKTLDKVEGFKYVLEKPGILDTPYFYLNFSMDATNRNVHEDDYPLIIRTAKKDDIMKINNGSATLRRQFINWKMPAELRDRWPLIENKKHEIIYVPRYDKDFKLTADLNFFVKI